MVRTDFTAILKNPLLIHQQQTNELKSFIEKFPYFQSARALYLKGLKNQDSFKYNNELKITAAHTTDRSVLFDFITSSEFNEISKPDIHHQITEKINSEKIALIPEKEVSEIIPIQEKVKEELSIGKPLSFVSNETHSFSQWLQLSTKRPINRTEKKVSAKVGEKKNIIDRFIENNPKISPVEKGKITVTPIKEHTSDSSLMTETLAKVYLEQKKYENAIQAYRILSLKYPEKSGFFADQIKRIQILQKNKS